MFKRTITLGLLALSFTATASRADEEVASLTRQLNGFNCLVNADRDKAIPLANRAADLVTKFAQAKKKTPERFKAIVQLVAAALPCSIESEAAFIVGSLRDEPGFQKAFDAALVNVPACKVKNLIATIKEGDDAAEGKAEPPAHPVFSYAACVTGREPQSTKSK